MSKYTNLSNLLRADDRVIVMDFRASDAEFLADYPNVESAEPLRLRIEELKLEVLSLMASLPLPTTEHGDKLKDIRQAFWDVKQAWFAFAEYVRAYGAIVAHRSGRDVVDEILGGIVTGTDEYDHYSKVQTRLHKRTDRYRAKRRKYDQENQTSNTERRRKARKDPKVRERENELARARYAAKKAVAQ